MLFCDPIPTPVPVVMNDAVAAAGLDSRRAA